MTTRKKLLLFTPFVYLSVMAFVFVLMVLGHCVPEQGHIFCDEGEWQILEGSFWGWGVFLIAAPLILSYGLIRLGEKATGRLESVKSRSDA